MDHLAHSRLTAQQLRVLALLHLRGPHTPSELASVLGVSGPTVSGLVDRLEAAGMVMRRSDPDDGRVRRVVATDAAVDALRDLVATRPPAEAEVLDALDDADLEHLALGAAALLRVMRARAGSGAADRHADGSDQGSARA
nr:MarR family transcriptional regulator [Cellulomonas sp. APG4]